MYYQGLERMHNLENDSGRNSILCVILLVDTHKKSCHVLNIPNLKVWHKTLSLFDFLWIDTQWIQSHNNPTIPQLIPKIQSGEYHFTASQSKGHSHWQNLVKLHLTWVVQPRRYHPTVNRYRPQTPNIPFHYPFKSQFQTLHSNNPVRYYKKSGKILPTDLISNRSVVEKNEQPLNQNIHILSLVSPYLNHSWSFFLNSNMSLSISWYQCAYPDFAHYFYTNPNTKEATWNVNVPDLSSVRIQYLNVCDLCGENSFIFYISLFFVPLCVLTVLWEGALCVSSYTRLWNGSGYWPARDRTY